MAKPRKRSNEQIISIVASLKSALFYVLVPAYTAINFDGVTEDDKDLNAKVVYNARKLIAIGMFKNCPECEKILFVGSKSGYPFVHFHELLKELLKNGA